MQVFIAKYEYELKKIGAIGNLILTVNSYIIEKWPCIIDAYHFCFI